MMVYDMPRIMVPLVQDKATRKVLRNTFEKLSTRPVRRFSEEMAMPDRQDLDSVVFDFLGLTQGERDAVYEAVIDLIESRLKKAESLSS